MLADLPLSYCLQWLSLYFMMSIDGDYLMYSSCSGWPLSRQVRQREIPWQFSDISMTFRGTRHVKCYSYHARILVLNTYVDANMQFTINSFTQLFPDISLIFSKIPYSSLTDVKFPNISRFSMLTSGHPVWRACCNEQIHFLTSLTFTRWQLFSQITNANDTAVAYTRVIILN